MIFGIFEVTQNYIYLVSFTSANLLKLWTEKKNGTLLKYFWDIKFKYLSSFFPCLQCEQIKFLLYYLSCLQNFIISISQIKIFNPLLKKNKNTIQPILKEHQFGLANLFVSYPLFNREMRHCVIEWGIPFFF